MGESEGTSYGDGYDRAVSNFHEDRHAFNDRIIEEFRANSGSVPSSFGGASVLLLHTTGAKSGLRRTHPLLYLPVDRDFVIFGTVGGQPQNPSWYHNLLAHPAAEVEVGAETVAVTARVVGDGPERERYWNAMNAIRPTLGEHQAKTPRQVPVIFLERRT